jgi:putative transposase
MPYWRLHYHLVWATYKREPMLSPERETLLRGVVYQKAKELGFVIHAVGNVEDHVHVVASIAPKTSVADCVRHFKGASSYAFNHAPGTHPEFKWQEGYGALTIGERSLPTVIAYANDQKRHHREDMLVTVYERMSEDENGVALQGVPG